MRIGRVGVIAVLLVAAALVLRIAYVDATPDYVLRHDAVDYDVHARSIAQGDGFSKTLAHGRPTAFRPPGYPYFLGAVYHVFKADREPARQRLRVARIAQAFVGTAIVALVGVLAAQLWGSVAGLVALGLAAIYLPFILVGGAVMSEPLFDVFMLASLAAALAYRRSPHRYRWALLAGVMGGLAALTRAQALILLAPLALAVWDGRPWRGRAALGPPVVLVLVALVTITPWTVRNARELHAFVPISTQFGSALAGTYNDSARADTQNPASWQGLRHVPDYAYLFNRVGETNEAVLEQKLRAASLHYIREHPTYVAKVALVEHAADARPRQPAPLAVHRGHHHHRPLLGRSRAAVLLDLRRAGARRGVHRDGPPRPVVRLGLPGAELPQRRLPRRGDPALPHADRPLPGAPRHDGAGHRRQVRATAAAPEPARACRPALAPPDCAIGPAAARRRLQLERRVAAADALEIDDADADERAGNRLERLQHVRLALAGDGEAVDDEAEDRRAEQRAEEGADDAAPEAIGQEDREVPDGEAHHDPGEHGHG